MKKSSFKRVESYEISRHRGRDLIASALQASNECIKTGSEKRDVLCHLREDARKEMT